MDRQSFLSKYIVGLDTGRSIPSRSDETVPVAWERNFDCPFCVLPQGKTLCQMQGTNPLPDDERFGRDFVFHKKSLQANLSDVRSLNLDSIPKRKAMDKLDCEQWPHVRRLKNWKTSFRREAITGSTRMVGRSTRQKSTQILDVVGSIPKLQKASRRSLILNAKEQFR